MWSYRAKNICFPLKTLKVNIKCKFSSQAQAASLVRKSAQMETSSAEWNTAQPFENIPAPKKLDLFKGFLPGGRYNGLSLLKLQIKLREDYGDLFLFPGMLGKRDILFTFNPEDFQKIYRTEGPQPMRRAFDILLYHRKVHRPDIFHPIAGLVAEQGEAWAGIRSKVNPVLMNPKTVKMYAPKLNKISDEFIERIRKIRDPVTNETPNNFGDDINHWAINSIGLIALDTELGTINNREGNPRADIVIDGMNDFFKLVFKLDFQPSMWKYISTPEFKKIIKTLDNMIELSAYYIDQAIERVKAEKLKNITKPDSDKSVLERLLSIDRNIAVIMAMDLLLGGSDTTSSALVGIFLCLSKNPEKQKILRDEILKILPKKDSVPTTDQLRHLPYLRACIKESLRLFPVSLGILRTTAQDLVLSGYRVPKGVDISMPNQLLMNDERYYGRPDEFLPERWLRDENTESTATTAGTCPLNSNVPFVFLPFGFGPRICIGKRIVELELEIALSKLIRNFEIQFDYPINNIFTSYTLNVPIKPLPFKFIDVNI